ncbi:MAG: xanthine dehydrogenase family protein molybdopterin-binding subunit [Fidelibacterota bacterium]|nr:MAG: xanthine dehydrogenase family protein molybdopterin-binding subunit [Candidatus Neomarinimicrobiota bacterium]
MTAKTTISRGDFLKVSTAAGTGLALAFHLPLLDKLTAAQALDGFEPNVWVSIDTSGTVAITMHRSELGQKVWTTLPMILAEELEADWSRVQVKQGHFNPAYGGQSTGGSASVRTSYDKLRRAGATAREMLITAAAQTWDVDRSSCRAENGAVIHDPTNRKLSYGELVETAARLPVPEEVSLKDPKDFKIIGKSMKSLNAASMVDGSALFGTDFKLPGMLTAVVFRCPVFGGKVASYDDSGARAVPGVRHVTQISSGVAVVADDTWSALQGREALKVTWDEGPNASLSSEDISRTLADAAQSEGTAQREEGDAQAALDGAAKKLDAVYEVPYLDHATMEPLNCTARMGNGSCEIWVSTQNPGEAHEAAMEITGLSAEAIKVHTLLSGGGFGRRLADDFVRDAVEVAKVLDVPVKVIRTRDENIQHGLYRPASYHHIQGGLDRKGQPVAWIHHVSGPADSSFSVSADSPNYGIDMAYAIPNVYVDMTTSDIPVPTGPWRSVANTQIAFVNESFIDELAHAAGKDPYEFRRTLIKEAHPRLLGVLDLAAEKAGWGKRRRGRYQGIAVHGCFRSYAALVAEVSVNRRGEIKVHKMVCAIDCGTVINPDGVKSQVEGGIVLALTAALHGAITLKNGRVQQSNFHNYKLLTMREMPVVEAHILPSNEPPTGVGEPPVPPTPPALTNAIFAATGKRIRRLPVDTGELKRG